jgi:hypothetical protein
MSFPETQLNLIHVRAPHSIPMLSFAVDLGTAVLGAGRVGQDKDWFVEALA